MTNNNKIKVIRDYGTHEGMKFDDEVFSNVDDNVYDCSKCKDKLGEVICPCEVAPKNDIDYEEWRNK